MSKSTSVLSNHTLNTNSIKELAEDLSKILKCNVVYGYYKNFDFEYQKKNNLDFLEEYNFIEQGKVTHQKSVKELQLTENGYCYRKFLQHYDKKTLEDDFFKKNSFFLDEILYAEKTLNFELYHKGDIVADINIHSLIVWEDYDLGWWYYCEIFTTKKEDYRDNQIQEWRQDLKQIIQKYGGNEVIIGCFETQSNDIFDFANEKKTWKEIKVEAQKKFGEKLLSVSNFYLSHKAKSLPKNPMDDIHINFYVKEGEDILEVNKEIFKKIEQIKSEYYDIYFDDFKDLI